MSVRNQQFYDSLKTFCESALSLLAERISLGSPPPVDVEVIYQIRGDGWTSRNVPRIEWQWFIYGNREKIKALESHGSVGSVMENDATISSHLDTLVGTVESKSRISKVEFLETVLLELLDGQEHPDFDVGKFDAIYRRVESLFFTEDVLFRALAPLYKFTMATKSLELGNDLSIVGLTDEEQATVLKDARENHLGPAFQVSTFAVQLYYGSPKAIGEAEPATRAMPSQIARERIDQVVSALRCFKGGRVAYFDIKTEQLNWPVGGTSHSFSRNVDWPGHVYHLSDIEVPEFSAFWREYQAVEIATRNRLRVSLGRLNFGYERTRPEDRLIDYIVGFEALLLGDQPDLRYKLSLRAAALLGESPEQRQAIFDELSAAYQKRSELVHGRNPNPVVRVREKEFRLEMFVDLIEDRLRAAIKEFLKRAARETEKQVIQALDQKLIRAD